MKSNRPFRQWLAFCLGALCLAALLFMLYAPAQGMMWGFDDYINLKGLAEVSSRTGLLEFLFGGMAGPGGRTLSLLSFIANYDDWPGNPWGFARLTLLLHFFNGLLLCMLLWRLLQREGRLRALALPVAAIAAAIWLLLPIHASGILLPVQRMTHVAAFFMLLTLYGYAVLRGRQPATPSMSDMLLLSLWVSMGSLLAFFSKENGVVVITLVALVEIFFFGGSRIFQWRHTAYGRQDRLWNAWIGLALIGIPVVLLAHAWWAWDGMQASYRYYRDFSMAERLATQAVISWEYIRQTLMPRGALLGPYHDGHTIYSWRMLQPYWALLAWAALAWLAWWMRKLGQSEGVRLAGKYLLFSIAWYVACHQVESSWVPLELYFEHRNYLAVAGFALGAAVFLGYVVEYMKSSRAWVLGLAGLLAGYHLLVLQQLTSLWGRPLLANEMWHIHHPASTRAAQSVINDLMRYGFQDSALKLAKDFTQEQKNIDVAIQVLPFLCEMENNGERLQEAWRNMHDLVAHIRKPAGITTGLATLGKTIRGNHCGTIDIAAYKNFLLALLSNEKVNNSFRVRHHVLYEMALIELQMGDVDAYARHAQQAFFDFPALSMGEAIALELFRAGRAEEGIQWIATMQEKAPNHLIKGSWKIRLQSLQEALRTISHAHQEAINDAEPSPLTK